MRSVVVKSIDKDGVRRSMDAWAELLLATRPDIEEIVVFGSFADDSYAPGSDLDVFVLMNGSDLPVRDRIPALLPTAFPVAVDLFPFTKQEIVAKADSPLLIAISRSRWRYARGSRSASV